MALRNSEPRGLPQPPYSEIVVGPVTGNASNDMVRLFTSPPVISVGQDILYTSDSVDGDSFKIIHDGIYSISYFDSNSLSASNYAITVNAKTLTGTTISALTQAEVKCATSTSAANFVAAISWSGFLHANDIVRGQTDNAQSAIGPSSGFRITRIG